MALAVLNSRFAAYALKLINPTLNFQVGDIARLPIPTTASTIVHALVERAIEFARQDSREDETTYDFVAPPAWSTGLNDIAARKAQLASTEHEIDEEVYRLYGISDEDRAAIEAELAQPVPVVALAEPTEAVTLTDDEVVVEEPTTRDALARRWVSYAVGIVLGRFQPGIEGAIGRGAFPLDVAESLRAINDTDGVATLDAGHPGDLAAKVEQALDIMVGEKETERIVAALGGSSGEVRASLRRYLEREFFKWHVQLYRKRPIYWLFQSPRRTYGCYVFHERMTRDTLYTLQGTSYLGAKINQTGNTMADLRQRAAGLQGVAQRQVERERVQAETLLKELEVFAVNLREITDVRDETGKTVGWSPEIDDGVLINLAPLHSILPSWSAEPRKCWERLAKGDYDWSHTAMRYWPTRVKQKCTTNTSYAIAHGQQ